MVRSLTFPVVQTSAKHATLVWVDRDGREDALNAPTAPYESPRLSSPDGRHVAVM